MKVSKLLTSFVGMILAGTVLAACGSDSGGAGDDSASGQTKVRLAFTPGATTLPVELALTKGYFKKRGLDVEDTQGLDLPTWMAGLDKQWDVAMETPGVFVSGADKLDLVVLAGGQVTTEGSLTGNPLITRDPDIKEPIDLVGKTVGVATITGSTPTALKYLVTEAGGDFDDVKLVQVGFDQQGDQLKAGAVDAVVSSSPFANVILNGDSEATALWDVQDRALRLIDPDQEVMASILYTSTRGWAEKNPEAAKAFQEALQEAADWMNANEDEAKSILAKWLGLPTDVVNTIDWPIPVQADITADNLQPVIDLFTKTGTVPEDAAPDLSDRFPNG